jgi:hypothetical protein
MTSSRNFETRSSKFASYSTMLFAVDAEGVFVGVGLGEELNPYRPYCNQADLGSSTFLL